MAEATPPTSPGSPSGAGRRPASPEPGGWILFAAVVLLIAGALNALWGLAAVLNDQVVRVGGRGVIVWDFTAWGWIHLILGALMLATGAGLLSMAGWARWLAVLFAALNAILQIGVITAFPLWSIVLIALDVVVIYHLTARWEDQLRSARGTRR